MFWATAEIHARLRQITLAWLLLVVTASIATVWGGDVTIVQWFKAYTWTGIDKSLIYTLSDAVLVPFYLLFLYLFLSHWRQRQRSAIFVVAGGYLIAQVFGSILLARVLKVFVGRARPDTFFADPTRDWIGFTNNSAFHSFPSGHTTDLFTGAIFLALLLPRWWMRLSALMCAVLVGLSRVVLGKHYPSDVIAGALIGGVVSLLVIIFWVLPRLKQQPVLR